MWGVELNFGCVTLVLLLSASVCTERFDFMHSNAETLVVGAQELSIKTWVFYQSCVQSS